MEKAYKVSDAAKILGIKVRTMRQWIHDGKVSAFKYEQGKNLYITEKEMKRLIEGRKDV